MAEQEKKSVAALTAPGASCTMDTGCVSGSCRAGYCCAVHAHTRNATGCVACAASTGECTICQSTYYLDSDSKCKAASGTTTAVVIVVVVILLITAV